MSTVNTRHLKLIFTVQEANVGSIIVDMEGRHDGMAIEIVENIDGRSRKAKELNGQQTTSPRAGQQAPDKIEIQRSILKLLQERGPLRKADISEILHLTDNQVAYARTFMIPKGLVTIPSHSIWQAVPGAEIEESTKLLTGPAVAKASEPKIHRPHEELRMTLLKALVDGPLTSAKMAPILGKSEAMAASFARAMVQEGLLFGQAGKGYSLTAAGLKALHAGSKTPDPKPASPAPEKMTTEEGVRLRKNILEAISLKGGPMAPKELEIGLKQSSNAIAWQGKRLADDKLIIRQDGKWVLSAKGARAVDKQAAA